jgi:hypothetical protein
MLALPKRCLSIDEVAGKKVLSNKTKGEIAAHLLLLCAHMRLSFITGVLEPDQKVDNILPLER